MILSKGHSTQGSKIPFISNLKKPACASKQDMLELATLWLVKNDDATKLDFGREVNCPLSD